MPPKKPKGAPSSAPKDRHLKTELRGNATSFRAQVSESSRRYLIRQSKDPYVKKAAQMGYRSRAAFKILEIHEKYHLLKPHTVVVDLGAAPGGWSQVTRQILGTTGTVIAMDKLPIDHIEGVHFLKGDFTEDAVYEELLALVPKGVDVVLSDMAPETTGHGGADHLKSMALTEMAAEFALKVLRPGGAFVCKIFQGGEETALRDSLRKEFSKVLFEKPPASRQESREIFLVCLGRTLG